MKSAPLSTFLFLDTKVVFEGEGGMVHCLFYLNVEASSNWVDIASLLTKALTKNISFTSFIEISSKIYYKEVIFTYIAGAIVHFVSFETEALT